MKRFLCLLVLFCVVVSVQAQENPQFVEPLIADHMLDQLDILCGDACRSIFLSGDCGSFSLNCDGRGKVTYVKDGHVCECRPIRHVPDADTERHVYFREGGKIRWAINRRPYNGRYQVWIKVKKSILDGTGKYVPFQRAKRTDLN